MKKACLILAISVFSFLYYMGALTQRSTQPFAKGFSLSESSPHPAESPSVRWPLFSKTESGRPRPSVLDPDELEKIYQLKLDRAIRNVPFVSFLLIRESRRARDANGSDRSVTLALWAVRFSPDFSETHFELARAHWHQNPFQISLIFSDLWSGLVTELRYFPTALNVLYNSFFLLSNALLLTLLIFGILILVRYIPLYVYDIQKDLTQEISALVANGIKIFVLFIPFFLRLDMLWAVLYWSILLWGYVSKKERQLVVLSLIVLAYVPFFMQMASAFLDGASAEVILEMNRANNEDPGSSTDEKLRAWLLSHPEDPEVLFTLGLIEKRRGRYAEAEKLYQTAIEQNPHFSEAYSNLGNVYMARKEVELAVAAYERAVELKPTGAAYHYNLSRAYKEISLLSGKKDQAFQRARELDPGLIDSYVRMADSSPQALSLNRLLIDETLRARRLWDRFLTQWIGREGFLFRLFRAWFERIPSRLSFLAPVLFLLFLLFMSRQSRAKRFLTRCPMCGSPTHRFYLGASEEEFICFNCHRIFIQREKLHPKIVEKKSLQVRQVQQEDDWVNRLLSPFLLGFGYLWRGHLWRGLLLLFLFFLFIMRFIYWNGVLALSEVRFPPHPWRLILWAGLFIVFYLLALRQSLRLRPRFRSELRRPPTNGMAERGGAPSYSE